MAGIAALTLLWTAGAAGSVSSVEDLTGRRFVRASVDPPNPYVRQQTAYTLHYYYETYLPTVDGISYALPNFQGFATRPLGRAPASRRIRIDGRLYYAEEIRIALFPLTEGVKHLPPARLNLPAYAGRPPRSLETERAQIAVRPLPTPIPAHFSGGVGEFNIRFAANRTDLTMEGSARLTLTIQGRGYLDAFTSVPPPQISNGQLYPPSVENRWDVQNGIAGGTRRIAYPFIPERAGPAQAEIPPIVTFSPSLGRYVSSDPKTIAFQVEPAKPTSNDSPRGAGRPVGLLLALLGTALLALIAWTARRRIAKRTEDANPEPAAVLEHLRALEAGDEKTFCGGLSRAVRSFAPIQRLRASNSPAANRLNALMEECAAVQFANGSLSEDRQREMREQALSAAADLISGANAVDFRQKNG